MKKMTLKTSFDRACTNDFLKDIININANKFNQEKHYLIFDRLYAISLSISNNGDFGVDSISFTNFANLWTFENTKTRSVNKSDVIFPISSKGNDTRINGDGYTIWFKTSENGIRLLCHMDDFNLKDSIDADISILESPKEARINRIETQDGKNFIFTETVNYSKVHGIVRFQNKEHVFSPENTFGILNNSINTLKPATLKWGGAAGILGDFHFGFNIECPNEKMGIPGRVILFHDDKYTEISGLKMDMPSKFSKTVSPEIKRIHTEDGRFNLNFKPIINTEYGAKKIFIERKTSRIYGHFSGNIVDKNNKVYEIHDFVGFLEIDRF